MAQGRDTRRDGSDQRVDRTVAGTVHRNMPGSEKYFISLTRKGWNRE